MAGDRSIQLSYCDDLGISELAKTFGTLHRRVLAQIRKTDHFVRFVFAQKFLRDRNSRIL